MNNKYLEIKKRAQLSIRKLKETQNTTAYLRVVGILSGLGFLIAPNVKPTPNSKVDFDDALRVGIYAEPRVLEVLPAAVLSFPKSFLHLERAPVEFLAVVNALKKHKTGPDFRDISFSKFLEAANRPTKSRRRKVLSEKRIPKTFRLPPEVIQAITKRAQEKNINCTAYLESLVRNDVSVFTMSSHELCN